MFPTNLQSPASDAEKLKHYYETQKIFDYPKTALGMPDMRSTINRNMIQDLLVTRRSDDIKPNHRRKQEHLLKILEEKRYTYNCKNVNFKDWVSILFKEKAPNATLGDHDAFMQHIILGLHDIMWHSSIDPEI
jgi:hypothetical protein